MENMKPYLISTLKEIALLGALKNKIEISSFDLAKKMKTSQQTASRYLLELNRIGVIKREYGIKKQIIEITELGNDILKKEYLDYLQIFELTDRIVFRGKVVSGIGEGRYYTEQSGYVKQFKEKLGFVPYPGTLNVEIEYADINKLRLLKNCKAIEIEEFKTKDRSFGKVICFHAEINGLPGAIVLPARSHYSNILEFISEHYLREKLNLKDNDNVDVVIYLGDKRK